MCLFGRSACQIGPSVSYWFADGVQVRARSFASRNQLAVTQREVDDATELEWDRRFLTVLGVANRRLYELRLQSSNESFEQQQVCALLSS
jgi:hypothetical protein